MKNSLIILIIPFVFLIQSCKVVRSLKQSSKDSVSIHQDKTGSSHTDSSGTKTDKTYTKETIYYQPIKDTTTNHFQITTPAPIVRIIETGHEQTQAVQIIKDTSWKDAFNSLAILIANKEKDSSTSVLSFWQLIGIAFLGIVFIGMVLVIIHFKNQITSIKQIISK